MAKPIQVPQTRDAKWDWLAQFLDERCLPPRCVSNRFTETRLDVAERRLGFSLPQAVREWYRRFGNRFDIWCAQDRLLHPDEMTIDGDLLVFLVESQGVVQWGITVGEVSLEDPPVSIDMCDLADECFTEGNSFSEFAVSLALYDFKFVAHYVAAGHVKADSDSLPQDFTSVPVLGQWHWPAYPTRFFLLHDGVLEIQGPAGKPCWIALSCDNQRGFDAHLKRLDANGIALSPIR